MKLALGAVAVAVALWGLHRAALWAESRGWIYYRKRRGSSGTLGNAFLEIQAMVEPSRKIVLEERRKDVHDEDDLGDGPGGAAGPASR